jgi:hypothetical protein
MLARITVFDAGSRRQSALARPGHGRGAEAGGEANPEAEVADRQLQLYPNDVRAFSMGDISWTRSRCGARFPYSLRDRSYEAAA